MDLSKYRDLFVAEAREHLEEAVEAVSRLQQAPGDVETLHRLFRHGHSLKGMAAAMGFTPIAQLGHALEDLFDDIRHGRVEFTPGRADAALRAMDGLADALDRVERGEDPPASLAALAAPLRGREEADGDAPPAPEPPAASPAAVTSDPAEGPVYNAEIRLDVGAAMPSARALVLYKRLESLGRILFATPDKASIATGRFRDRLLVQFASTTSEHRLRAELEGIPEVSSVVLVAAAGATPPPPAPETSGPSSPEASASPSATVRIRTDILDRFLDHMGELIIHESRLENSLRPAPAGPAAAAVVALRKTLERLSADLMDLRMVPFEHVAPRLVRSARNLGGNLGKRVTLTIHGRDVRLDRAILEELVDPINHILRNAVDHGIEPPEERLAAGKDGVGRITIRNTEYAESVRIEVEDDGRGMDASAIRQAAVQRGFLRAEEAGALGDAEALMLVTIPGFSTAARLTEVSGRGVGMDVVRNRVESLGGRLRLQSTPGRGTRIILTVPLTVAVIHAFLVRAGARVFAVPVTGVARTFEVAPARVRRLGGVPVLALGDEAVELLWLRELVAENGEADAAAAQGASPALLFHRDDRALGLVVDELLSKRDIVVKRLGPPLDHLREYSGATVLEDGRIALILDLPNLHRRS